MMKCIVVDDEPLARKGIKNYVEDVPYLQLVGTCTNGVEVSELLEKVTADIIFLDIQMPKMTGINFLKVTKSAPMVIITSAYPHYALQSFEYDVVDYLLKPITFERFFQACNKAYELWKITKTSTSESDYFFIKCEGQYEKINKEDILYIKGLQNYITIHTGSRKLTTLIYLKDIIEMLGKDRFVRTHKSFVVAKDKVTQIKGNELKIGDTYIPISRHYKNEVISEVVGDKLWKR